MEQKLPDLKLIWAESIFNSQSERIISSRLYCSYFGMVPSVTIFRNFNFYKCMKYFEKHYEDQILDKHTRQYLDTEFGRFTLNFSIYILKNEIIVEIDEAIEGRFDIFYNQKVAQEAEKITNDLLQFRMRTPKSNQIHLVIPTKNGLDKASVKINKPKIKLETHYNKDLELSHSNILKQLKKEKQSGLFLFYGEPGTGKSTYIRYLVQLVKKTVIFISPNIAGNLDSPDFTKFLIENSNSIFVIEDAENLIISRDSENNSAISTILNLTDGLLGEGLGIQFICTFNTHLSRIDKALLRKGRLKALYEFGVLSVEKSNYLLSSLELDYETNKPMTLAEIYNLKEEKFDFDENKRIIGFAA